jgi:hypothetical protein
MLTNRIRPVKGEAPLRAAELRREFRFYAALAATDGSKAGRVVARYLERAAAKVAKGGRA